MTSLPKINTPVSMQTLDRKITELHDKSLLPPELVNLVSGIARIQLDAESFVHFPGAEPLRLPPGLASAAAGPGQRAQGSPILPAASFPLDLDLASKLVPRILATLQRETPTLVPVVRELEEMLLAGPESLETACREALHRTRPDRTGGCFDLWEKRHPESPNTLFFVAHSAVMPSLAVAGRLLGKEHDNERVWEHGHCPVCGSLPLMGRLLDGEGARLHTCSFCAFEYRVPRMNCPFCLADRGDGAEYLASDEEPGYLLEICAECKTCFKLADFRQFDRPFIASLDDLSSLMLDMRARQMLFDRLTPSAWGF